MTRSREFVWACALVLVGVTCLNMGIKVNIATAMNKYISPLDYRKLIGSYDCERAQAVYAAYKGRTRKVFQMPPLERNNREVFGYES